VASDETTEQKLAVAKLRIDRLEEEQAKYLTEIARLKSALSHQYRTGRRAAFRDILKVAITEEEVHGSKHIARRLALLEDD
jgi:hypothetical protein